MGGGHTISTGAHGSGACCYNTWGDPKHKRETKERVPSPGRGWGPGPQQQPSLLDPPPPSASPREPPAQAPARCVLRSVPPGAWGGARGPPAGPALFTETPRGACLLTPNITLGLVKGHRFLCTVGVFSVSIQGYREGRTLPHPTVHNPCLKVGHKVIKSGPRSNPHMQPGPHKSQQSPQSTPKQDRAPIHAFSTAGRVSDPEWRVSLTAIATHLRTQAQETQPVRPTRPESTQPDD